MPVKKVTSSKIKKIATRQPRVADDVRSAVSKTRSRSRSLNKRLSSSPKKTRVSTKPAFDSSASGLPPRSKSSMTTQVFDLKGKVVGNIDLPKEIFGAKINNTLMAQAVRVYLANQRLGTHFTKSRGEVNATTKKAWKQKGTGRARHGARSAPIFVGGGVAHGPKPRDYSLKFPKKMKKVSLFSALSVKLKDGEIKVLAGLEKIEPKTKIMAGVLKNIGLADKKLLLVTSDGEKEDYKNVYRAGRNIKRVNILNAKLLNTYEVLDNKMLVLTKDAVLAIKENFLGKGA